MLYVLVIESSMNGAQEFKNESSSEFRSNSEPWYFQEWGMIVGSIIATIVLLLLLYCIRICICESICCSGSWLSNNYHGCGKYGVGWGGGVWGGGCDGGGGFGGGCD